MDILVNNKSEALFNEFISDTKNIISVLEPYNEVSDINELKKFISNFKIKTDDFYNENRKLNIGVVGQVKAGKSSFLNTLLFDGRDILPKASTPKTAALTKMEYADKNVINIEYYSEDEWAAIEDNANVDSDEDTFTAAKELTSMVRQSGINPYEYLKKAKMQRNLTHMTSLFLSLIIMWTMTANLRLL